jgi:hypothetical protein
MKYGYRIRRLSDDTVVNVSGERWDTASQAEQEGHNILIRSRPMDPQRDERYTVEVTSR